MILPILKRLGRRGLSGFSWYQRLGYRWQPPTPTQPLAREPFVLRLSPPTTERDEKTRNIPYILRGRNEEMTEIARRLFDPGGSLSVVEGPPGIGKTTLMRAVGQYAENQGFAWIRLNRLDLCNLQRFNRAMLRVKPSEEHSDNIIRKLRPRFGVPQIASVELGGGQDPGPLTRNPHATVSQALRQHVHARGILITVDDGRGVLHNHSAGSVERKVVADVLSMLNDNLRIRGQTIPAQTIVGGLTGTISEVQEAVGMRLADAHFIVLDKIPASAVQATIEDCLRVTEPASGLEPAKFPAEFIHECAERCHGHPLQATAVGRSLQEIGIKVAMAGRFEVTSTDVVQARATIKARMEDSYRTRSRNIMRRDAEVLHDLARAITQWGPRIGFRAVEQLVQVSGSRANKQFPAENDEPLPRNWLEHLRTKGLVVTYVATERYPRIRHMELGAPYAEIDLPSFASYLTALQTEAKGMLSAEELEKLVPPEERNLPAWDWPEAGKWHPIEQLAPAPVGNPYALEPTLPCDRPDPAINGT